MRKEILKIIVDCEPLLVESPGTPIATPETLMNELNLITSNNTKTLNTSTSPTSIS